MSVGSSTASYMDDVLSIGVRSGALFSPSPLPLPFIFGYMTLSPGGLQHRLPKPHWVKTDSVDNEVVILYGFIIPIV